MAKQLITWQEKVSATAYDTIYPETLSEQVHINNEIANNLGISPEVSLDTALGKLSATDKNIRAQGVATGTATALALSVNVFTLFDGVVVRAKIPFDTEKGLTLNVNNTGAKSIYRIDGQPIDLVLKSGAWCTFIYSSALDGWVLQGWSTKPVLKTEVITKTQTWTVPDGVTSVNVLLFGGGGGGGYTSVSHEPTYEETGTGAGGGGGGGYMAKSTLTVTPKQTINITIGAGGASGAYNTDGNNGGVTSFGTLLSAQGGGGGKKGTSTYTSGKGGDGGTGGSGGGGGSASKRRNSESSRYNYVQPGGNGGNGAQFGGGGGAYRGNGGNGGQYGGGGGAGDGGTAGVGGQYGGSGGAPGKMGSAGTNTTSIADIDFKGEGKGGNGYTSGSEARSGGGGGGYGGNGGNGGSFEGGGGGGYGGNGTNGGYGSGGGGYGASGYKAGGGGYGVNNYGHGGDSDGAGASGICVITYIAQES